MHTSFRNMPSIQLTNSSTKRKSTLTPLSGNEMQANGALVAEQEWRSKRDTSTHKVTIRLCDLWKTIRTDNVSDAICTYPETLTNTESDLPEESERMDFPNLTDRRNLAEETEVLNGTDLH